MPACRVQAPYNRFAGKEALLAEVARDGFECLAHELNIVGEGSGKPLDQLRRAAETYIDFALSAPALFRVMFSRELVDLSRCPELQLSAGSALQALRQVVARLVPVITVDHTTLTAWSVVHGYATFQLELGWEDPAATPTRAALFAQMIAATTAEYRRPGVPEPNGFNTAYSSLELGLCKTLISRRPR